eukprot:TRINITY_DN5936_c0_g1_i2.p3 TRINITY_DN5936_c0_g1~~TRINITY_DN5936_c0_g1_i2.p3  ORF type:complete len:111 (+),score=9.62 TRINITY_DN5936_c0_g1_i2:700-1032(+)
MSWHRPRSLMDLGSCAGPCPHHWSANHHHRSSIERCHSFHSRDKKSYSTGSLNQSQSPRWRHISHPGYYHYSEDDTDIEDDFHGNKSGETDGDFSRGSSDHIDEYRDVAL